MKILIADDNPTNRKLLRVVLEAEGIVVVEAADGVEALRCFERERFDAIVSDVLMPNKDGYQLCHELRRSPGAEAVPFIFYTNTYTSASSEKLAYEFGADGFIKKPASVEAMLATIHTVLARPRAHPPAGHLSAPPADTASYNRHLIAKLEDQNLELEAARERLLQINHQLLERTKSLESAEAKLRETNLLLESRVRERTRELERANEELETFAYSASHDLQAPLRAVGGYIDLLLRKHGGGLSADGARCLRVVKDSSARMSRIVESLLDLARSRHGGLGVREVDVSELARSIVEELAQANPGRRVEMSISPGLRFQADEALLRIAMANLIGNAWKYTALQRAPKIEVGEWPGAAAGTKVLFVRDNGAGFDPEKKARLFVAFERLHGEREFAGSGVGLATVKRIVDRHGGEIWAEGAPGEGATFFMALPYCA